MARLPRLSLPGFAQHMIQRGNNREACFYMERDYKVYLGFLKDAAVKHQVAIHAFVLMTNHVHLLLTPGDQQGVSHMMQSIRFKAQIEAKTGRRPVPRGRGGDRKSAEFREAKNQ